MKKSDKIFYFFQALLINWEFNCFEFIRPFIYRFFFKNLGKNIRILAGVHFKYPSEIEIGDNAYIGRGCIFVGKGGVRIGKDALIGSGCKICTTSHVYEAPEIAINKQGIKCKSISIGDDVWLGFDCKVLGGVVVKERSIIATNSVLLENQVYKKNSIIAGIPAKKKGNVNDKK